MISHRYRCIFVHIPRTGGSSVEHWLVGQNWWAIEPATKHLTARQARMIYADYWQDYFKFTLVRHPLDRSLSMLHYAEAFGLAATPDGGVDFAGYKAMFGSPVTVEFDTAFYSPQDVRHRGQQAGQVYGNILDAELDFIGRYETLAQDMDRLRLRLGVTERFGDVPRALAKSTGPKSNRDHPATRAEVLALYDRDFDTYGYQR